MPEGVLRLLVYGSAVSEPLPDLLEPRILYVTDRRHRLGHGSDRPPSRRIMMTGAASPPIRSGHLSERGVAIALRRFLSRAAAKPIEQRRCRSDLPVRARISLAAADRFLPAGSGERRFAPHTPHRIGELRQESTLPAENLRFLPRICNLPHDGRRL